MTSQIEEQKSERLADWEIETIAAVAQEDFDAETLRGIIWDPEKWLAVAITKRQTRVLENASVRAQLSLQAQRLGIGHRHPKRVEPEPELPTPDDSLAARWWRVTATKMRTDPEHEWARLVVELVTDPTSDARRFGRTWKPLHEGMGIIDILEIEAERHGLFSGLPPKVNARQAVAAAVGVIGRAAA